MGSHCGVDFKFKQIPLYVLTKIKLMSFSIDRYNNTKGYNNTKCAEHSLSV